MKNHQNQLYLLAINLLPGLGPKPIKQLWEQFNSPEEAFLTPAKSWNGISKGLQIKLGKATKDKAFAQANEILDKVEKKGYQVIDYFHTEYPQRLKHCADPPTLLFSQGNVSLNPKRAISIVGTRSATSYGLSFCKDFIANLKPYNCTVISGLALGIDSAVHKACLEEDIPTIAVLGNSLDFTYPAQNRSLSRKIEKHHRLLSEFPIDTKPDRGNFPMRNRIVAGMSDATVVVEAAAKGGALITAELAFGYHREVFAVPGRLTDKYSEGCNALIWYHRAQILRSVEDLAKALNWRSRPKKAAQLSLMPELSANEKLILSILQKEIELDRDELSIKTKLNIGPLLVEITNLELKGLIKSLPGNRYELG